MSATSTANPPAPSRMDRPDSGQGKSGKRRNSAAEPADLEISVSLGRLAKRLFMFCVSMEALFFVLDYHVNHAHGTEFSSIRRMFNTTREDGMASWFAVSQTLLVAVTAAMIWFVVRRKAVPRWRKFGWGALAIFLFFMAADDGSVIHERLGSAYKQAQVEAGRTIGFDSYAWQKLFVPFYGAAGLAMLAFLWKELGTRRSRVLIVTVVSLWTAAVGFDYVEGLEPEHEHNLYTSLAEFEGVQRWADEGFDESAYVALRHFSKSFEECFEMLASSILWFLFLCHLARELKGVRLRFLPPGATAG